MIHRFNGEWGERYSWEGSRSRRYDGESAAGVTETWLIGKAERARNFAIRYYELDVNGRSRQEEHAHDHGLVFLRGQGRVLLGDEWNDVAQGDVVFIAPDEKHQIVNTGEETLGFLCVIPAVRMKKGEKIWAEEGLELEENR